MKASKKNLEEIRKLVRKLLIETTAGPPISGDHAISLGGTYDGPPRNEGAHMAEEVAAAIRSGQVGVDYERGTDEIYIMTGRAEGITIKVLRRGR
jgi:hypothetical protein